MPSCFFADRTTFPVSMSMGAWDGRHRLEYGLWFILCLRMSPHGGPMSIMGSSYGGIHAYGHTGIGSELSLCLPYVGAMGYPMHSVCRHMPVSRPAWWVGWGYPNIQGYMDMIDAIPMPAVWG